MVERCLGAGVCHRRTVWMVEGGGVLRGDGPTLLFVRKHQVADALGSAGTLNVLFKIVDTTTSEIDSPMRVVVNGFPGEDAFDLLAPLSICDNSVDDTDGTDASQVTAKRRVRAAAISSSGGAATVSVSLPLVGDLFPGRERSR